MDNSILLAALHTVKISKLDTTYEQYPAASRLKLDLISLIKEKITQQNFLSLNKWLIVIIAHRAEDSNTIFALLVSEKEKQKKPFEIK